MSKCQYCEFCKKEILIVEATKPKAQNGGFENIEGTKIINVSCCPMCGRKFW
jgi:hypothetical protein